MVEILKDNFLEKAEQEGKFQWQETEFHMIEKTSEHPAHHRRLRSSSTTNGSLLPAEFTTDDKRKDSPIEKIATSHQPVHSLRWKTQRTRPQHISGINDSLPFRNKEHINAVFTALDLPSSYFLIASGSPAACQSRTLYDKSGRPIRYELTAHCVTKRGDWAMALSHRVESSETAVFWSVDHRIDSQNLINELISFKEYAFHPLLIPCIMFSETLRMNIARRQDIKERLRDLEHAIRQMGRKPSFHASELDLPQQMPTDVPELFKLLYSCRKDQESQSGRCELWKSLHEAIEEGFKYYTAPEEFTKMHYDLKSWSNVTWRTLRSLHARDEDHIRRVNHVSDELGNIIQQRETRLHATIARAAQRDSEDMKFIAVLGSIFLPASLIATVLNVPQFQFLPGAKLFAAYLGITIPLIGIVVLLCFSRRQWISTTTRLWWRHRNSAERRDSTFTASIA